jgi:hypothetical protein
MAQKNKRVCILEIRRGGGGDQPTSYERENMKRGKRKKGKCKRKD